MACDFIQLDDLFIHYVAGSLKPSVRKKFEEHYFVCDRCFKALQVLEEATRLMRRRGGEIFKQRQLEILP
jgi:hypothetical protein